MIICVNLKQLFFFIHLGLGRTEPQVTTLSGTTLTGTSFYCFILMVILTYIMNWFSQFQNFVMFVVCVIINVKSRLNNNPSAANLSRLDTEVDPVTEALLILLFAIFCHYHSAQSKDRVTTDNDNILKKGGKSFRMAPPLFHSI